MEYVVPQPLAAVKPLAAHARDGSNAPWIRITRQTKHREQLRDDTIRLLSRFP
jgi:hypothetical protein